MQVGSVNEIRVCGQSTKYTLKSEPELGCVAPTLDTDWMVRAEVYHPQHIPTLVVFQDMLLLKNFSKTIP